MKVLVIDIGGTSIKILATGHPTPIKLPSGPQLTPKRMIRLVLAAIDGWEYSVVSIGYPGPVKDNKPARKPRNLGRGWVAFDFGKAFDRPVKVINDAAMQALGSYKHGRMLFLGLGHRARHHTHPGWHRRADGTGASAVQERADLRGAPRESRTAAGRQEKVAQERGRCVRRFRAALEVDDVVIGGGNAKLLKRLPPGVRSVGNTHAFVGGFRLWKQKPDRPSPHSNGLRQ